MVVVMGHARELSINKTKTRRKNKTKTSRHHPTITLCLSWSRSQFSSDCVCHHGETVLHCVSVSVVCLYDAQSSFETKSLDLKTCNLSLSLSLSPSLTASSSTKKKKQNQKKKKKVTVPQVKTSVGGGGVGEDLGPGDVSRLHPARHGGLKAFSYMMVSHTHTHTWWWWWWWWQMSGGASFVPGSS